MNTYSRSITLFPTFRHLVLGFALLFCFMASGNAASDADVTIIKATTIVIEENTITITAEARSTVRLISGDHNPDYKGETWHGVPVSTIQVYSGSATFVIKRPLQGGETTDRGWKMSLEAAKNLQAGNEVGRIGYYAPDMTIKGNLIDSITGFGFLYPKRE
jgi:hypothetical protein